MKPVRLAEGWVPARGRRGEAYLKESDSFTQRAGVILNLAGGFARMPGPSEEAD